MLTFVVALGGVYWRSYYQDLVVLLRSMTRVNAGDPTTVAVVHDGRINDKQIEYLKQQWPLVRATRGPSALYAKHGKTNPKYFLFEAWNPDVVQGDRAILMGADMIARKPWTYLHEALGPIRAWREPARPCWNSGALLVTKPLIDIKERDKLLATAHDGNYGTDQRIINQIYGDKMQGHPDWVQVFDVGAGCRRDALFVHYIHKYYARTSRISNFWRRMYEEYLTEAELEIARAPGFDFWCEALNMGTAKPASWYDAEFVRDKNYGVKYTKSRYYQQWKKLLTMVKGLEGRILELGCGPGQFAAMLEAEGLTNYVGIDFSPKAVEMATKATKQRIVCKRIEDSDLEKDMSYSTVLILETLEHMTQDVETLKRIRTGSNIIFTVPKFDGTSHVRHFKQKEEVRKRYGECFKSLRIAEHGQYWIGKGIAS